MNHRIIDGRVMRVVNLEAADTRENYRHIMNDRPIPGLEQRDIRESGEVDAARR